MSYSHTADGIVTVYSYAPHGNVEWIVQHVPGLGDNYIRYEYDLISGKVTEVAYNEFNEDRFFHRYGYDEENRIISCETSRDHLIWDQDANYDYFATVFDNSYDYLNRIKSSDSFLLYIGSNLLFAADILFLYIWRQKQIIEDRKLNIEKLLERFNDVKYLSTKDITDFYLSIDSAVKKTTINWRIYSLVQKGILARIGRGKFQLGPGKIYVPEIYRKEKIIYNKLIIEFPFVDVCIWNTKILNEFMHHQPGSFQIIVEVEKDVTQSVFYFLKELKYPVFIEPTEEILEKYMPTDKEAIIIKSLVSESPLQELGSVKTVTIEKILVDIFCDTVVFTAQQGAELSTIFNTVFDKYTVNQSKMYRYASRRRKKEAFVDYVNQLQIYGSNNINVANI